jgi:hypothetical protein
VDEIRQTAGAGNVGYHAGLCRCQPSSYPINTIFLWTGGSHEGVLQVGLKKGAGLDLQTLEAQLRVRFAKRFPAAQFSFEPGDIVNRIMNFGTSTPVEVAITGPDFAATRTFARRIRDELARIPALRELQYRQALDYPEDSGGRQSPVGGLTGTDRRSGGTLVRRGDSSSRFVAPNHWADHAHGHRVPGPD